MPSIFQKIQAKLELYRLEQRYTRNRNRRSTFISNAVYVDGEYVYNTPNTTGSSKSSAASSPSAHQEYHRRSLEDPRSPTEMVTPTPAQKKRQNRFSAMANFGSLSKAQAEEWRSTVDVHEVR
jgi:hypothetical protein